MLKPQFYANRETEKTGELFSFSPDTFIGSVQQIKRFICHVVVAQNAMDLVAMHVEDLHRQLEMVNVSIINQQQCFSKRFIYFTAVNRNCLSVKTHHKRRMGTNFGRKGGWKCYSRWAEKKRRPSGVKNWVMELTVKEVKTS